MNAMRFAGDDHVLPLILAAAGLAAVSEEEQERAKAALGRVDPALLNVATEMEKQGVAR